ncbi:FOG: Transposon-encoded proteins with TYA, reverse transcriptase, integrase domains in various combinations [Plasmopara halstedii]|uniref:FOG: Transposon-encoded proteins with TYA, reverse transcriptase, integrase domains in various combinations n=1 Tax=Plasmopara halstedii TaxID=4781 RepID=A0A0P1AI98_PLAHL|nr:FOG: Transposon-encoded proteins with TYA, reverse transcriptase, integrase domains in various combinations [Plasmopara halstedii]CEG40223.1 FOG: Transposon-encoded proteins with TYA, reverse transcriptase, integrase domains in various combinations [Plasmopara halstedii]|eukprot:XP_024576592.1 FOG: Transposon-encoded proteins with TYA, reverse transcriptase, integrase domains in various combinations [Plasmopara halstedii]
MMIVGTYLDNLVVTGTNDSRVSQFFTDIAVLELKDLGVSSKILGIRVQYNELNSYKFDQEVAFVEMLTKFGLEKTNPVRASIRGEVSAEADMVKLQSHATKKTVSVEPTVSSFQSLLGSLLWPQTSHRHKYA